VEAYSLKAKKNGARKSHWQVTAVKNTSMELLLKVTFSVQPVPRLYNGASPDFGTKTTGRGYNWATLFLGEEKSRGVQI
jgi:hypothetical protein